MGFGSKIVGNVVMPERGFSFAAPKAVHYAEGRADAFRVAIVERSEAVEFMSPGVIRAFGLDGRLDQGLRMSDAAFSDLCSICGMQPKSLNRMAEIDPDVATRMVDSMVEKVFRPHAADRMVVVDTKERRVDGIVTRKHYRPYRHDRLLELATTAAGEEMTFTNGWINGSVARFTFVSPRQIAVTPAVGDTVRFGMSYENSLNGETSIRIANYNERLVCTNGMTASDDVGSTLIPHRGDLVDDFVRRSVLDIAKYLRNDEEMIKLAASRDLIEPEIRALRKWTASSANGGSSAFETRVVKDAIEEANDEGKDGRNGEVSLWNYVNAFTSQQHGASFGRRNVIEAMGRRCLRVHAAKMLGFNPANN